MSNVTMRFGSSVLTIVLALSLLLPETGAQASPLAAPEPDRLSKRDRQLIAEARAEGDRAVTLLIAAREGSNDAVASRVEALGGDVEYRDNELDYVRVRIPIGKAEQIAKLAGVRAADVDEIIPLDDPRPEGSVDPSRQPPPGPATGRDNPYMPTGDTGAAQFVEAHPGWDGRGVTVGIIDSGVDLDHPSLRRTSTNRRKIVDWVTYTHPETDDDPTWVAMRDEVRARRGAFVYRDQAYRAPRDGAFRIGLFDERDSRLGGEVGNDVNRDGNPAGSSGVFAVLKAGERTVWVDTDQDNSFADEKAMTDYRRRYDIGQFGADRPGTEVKDYMKFVVQTRTSADGVNDYVNIGIVSGAHGSHVAGIVAANKMFGGEMSGAAPGAKLVSVRVCLFVAGCTSHALLEGMIYAAKTANVDVINMSIGGLPALNDAHNARAVLYDRLIEEEKVQMFISAGNSGPGVNTVGDPSVASRVMSVGSYITDASWRSNYGSDSAYEDNLHSFSSRGPREDGGFKPQIVAPGSAVSTVPTWQPGGPVPGTYTLPAGYAMFNGTSMASPQAAGAAALLLGAARQNRVRVDPAQLRQAMNSSSRYLDPSRFEAYDQGNGLIDVNGAWNLLRIGVRTVTMSAQVPVSTPLGAFLQTPGFGQGIYDREGVEAGDSYVRKYTITRTSGPNRLVRYDVAFTGNDGTFAAPTSIALAKNIATDLEVRITPATEGSHTAIMNLNDPATAGIDYQTMNVVIAAERFTEGNDFAVETSGVVGRNQVLRYFFDVPKGTPAFKVDFSGPTAAAGTGQARFLRFHPWGYAIDSNASTSCYLPPLPAGCSTGGPGSRTVQDPTPGVWEVTVDGRRTSDAEDIPFTLSASILGVKVAPDPDVIETAQANVGVERTYSFENLYRDIIGSASGTGLGSAKTDRSTIANGASQQYRVTVDAGSTKLTARIGNTSDRAADLDLFLYDCTSGTCVLAGQSADGDSEEAVTIANPTAGTWTVLVDGYAVPEGTTAYDYLDVFANVRYGEIVVTDPVAPHAGGSTWTAPGVVTAKEAPAGGRILLGNVVVKTDEGVTIGTGEVRVLDVTP